MAESPRDIPVPTGDGKIRAATSLVADLESLPLEDHPRVFAQALTMLNESLSVAE